MSGIDIERLTAMIGQTLPGGDWVTIDQDMVDQFAVLTGDEQWIHVDVERSERESPFGGTVAHGLFILALVPKLTSDASPPWYEGSIGVNYGADRLRFISPVRAGSRVRASQTLKAVEPYGQGARLTSLVVVEIDGVEKPACSVEMIGLVFS